MNLSLIVLNAFFLVISTQTLAQRYTLYPSSQGNLFQDISSKKVGLCAGLSFSSFTPEAYFHIQNDLQEDLDKPLFKIQMLDGIGSPYASLSTLYFNDYGVFYGIHQKGPNNIWNCFQSNVVVGVDEIPQGFPNYTLSVVGKLAVSEKINIGNDDKNPQFLLSVNGKIDLKEGINFSHNEGHRYGITIDNTDPDDLFYFTYTNPYNMLSNPLIIDPMTGVITHGILVCDRFKMLEGAGENKVMVSDADGLGVWKDASQVHDDDWLSSIPQRDDGQVKNLYRGPGYSNVGIGTDNPLNKLHVQSGNILVSRDLNEPPGSINGNIYFGGVVSEDYPNGEWGIEYREHGLNFWKVVSASNPGGNYRLFLKDDGSVGIGTANPISKFQINADYEKLSAGSLASSSAIQGTSYIGFNAARDDRDQWTVEANSDLSKNGGSAILSDIEGNTYFSCIPSLEGASGSSSQTLTDAMVFDNVKMTVASNGHVGIGTDGQIMGQLNVSSPDITYAVVNSRAQSQAVLWAGNQNAYMGFGVDGSGTGHIYRGFQSQYSIVSFAYYKVGIGNVDLASCTNSTHKLFVEDGITTEEVIVKLKEDWSDYVFDEDYPLMPLSDLRSYIDKNKHLPDIPTEEEVKLNGIELGQMNALLLKKVEELTLYVIELKSDLNELRSQTKQ